MIADWQVSGGNDGWQLSDPGGNHSLAATWLLLLIVSSAIDGVTWGNFLPQALSQIKI